jgi:glucose/arabinose dehydrogenase
VGITAPGGRTLGAKYVALQRIARLKNPVYLTQPPGPGMQLYVVQKGGAVRVISNDHLLRRPFLDIGGKVRARGVRGEPGMSSIAFAPDYRRTGVFYIAYTDQSDALVIARYRRSAADPLVADPASGQTLLRIPEPTPLHHGGTLAFGPNGYLYVGTGDGGDVATAQDPNAQQGKLLRMNPAISGPPEIWASGLRNPRSISFDKVNGTIAIGDVGDKHFEEIDYLPLRQSRGANFGWPAFEAKAPFHGGVARRDTVLPVLAYRHGPDCAVVGGFIVRDPRLARIRGREIYGDFVFGDYCTGTLYGFRPRAGRRVGKQRAFHFGLRTLTSIARDNSGRVYLVVERGPLNKGKPSLGSVYRLVPRRKEIPG